MDNLCKTMSPFYIKACGVGIMYTEMENGPKMVSMFTIKACIFTTKLHTQAILATFYHPCSCKT